MNTHQHKIYLLAFIVMLISGCAKNSAYRTDYSLCTYNKAGDCTTHAIQQFGKDQSNEYKLGFVEFGDQGQLRHRQQMQSVLDHFYTIAAQEDVLLITFTHGWHHNSSPGDTNIQEFRALLSKVSCIERTGRSICEGNEEITSPKPRKVLGLYIGWRGESITTPWIREATFWDRKSTAQDVGLQGVTEVMLKLEEIVNVKAGIEQEDPKPLNSRLVVIGHSFGGAMLFTSLQQVLADRFINSRRNKTYSSDAEGFGNLVVLVNPAFEALRFGTLYDISQHKCRLYFPSQLPKLAILTSESDYATKYAFPLGRIFSTFFESHLTLERQHCTANGPVKLLVKEGKADRNTVGHFEPYLTHHLVPLKDTGTRDEDFNYVSLRTAWSKQQDSGSLLFEDTKLIHLGKTRPLNPYLNIKVDNDIIPDHNDIWGDEVVNFIRDLIIISSLPVTAK